MQTQFPTPTPISHKELSITTRKERSGRWTPTQAYLFESLLQKYGKNWKRIHQHMKGRTLSQIRSHGQKYFDKIGAKKVQELCHRAKLIQAYEILDKSRHMEFHNDIKQQERYSDKHMIRSDIKQQESMNELITSPEFNNVNKTPEFIKEQIKQIKQQEIIKEYYAPIETNVQHQQYQGGFLIQLINMNPHNFAIYGIDGFIDYPRNYNQ